MSFRSSACVRQSSALLIALLWIAACVVTAALLLAAPRMAHSEDDAINTVTNANDSGPGSLRGVIAAANSGDIISFDPSVTGAIVLTTGEVPITKSLTIVGPGRDVLAVSGNNASRVFSITAGSAVVVSGLTIRNGASASFGGGVYTAGVLTLINSAVLSNTAGSGGGIFVESASGGLTLNSSTVAGNAANQGDGGGIALGPGVTSTSGSGAMLLTNSIITGNSAASQGGGVSSTGPVTVTSSLIANNSAASGGGVSAFALALSDSSILRNRADDPLGAAQADGTASPQVALATGDGGGIYSTGAVAVHNSTIASNTADSSGGGVAISGTLTISNSTLSGNTANLLAGAIANKGGSAAISFSTIARNSALFSASGIAVAGSATLRSTILDNAGAANCALGPAGTIASSGNNLDSGNMCGLNAPSDLTDVNPSLGPLANNGGTTFTHALPFGSPAVNAGGLGICPSTDQRGVPRPQGPACDIGAYEAFPPRLFLPNVVKQ
jgi:hypothetical protein